jgi:hypothetical protein
MSKTVSNWKMYARRLGWAGFFFFLIKGLVWLAVFFGLSKAICNG